MIKFLFKLVIVIIIALAAVIYHNTDSGKKMEKKIGEEVDFEKMSERGKDLLEKAIYFLSLKGLEYKKKTEDIQKGPLKVKLKEDIPPKPSVKSSGEKENKKKTTEKIGEEDRKRLEEILEKEG